MLSGLKSTIMKFLLYFMLRFLSNILMSWNTRNEFSVDGWKIDLDIEKEFISISHKKLGVVLDNVKLHAIVDNAGSILTGWEAKHVVNKLIIKTSKPIYGYRRITNGR